MAGSQSRRWHKRLLKRPIMSMRMRHLSAAGNHVDLPAMTLGEQCEKSVDRSKSRSDAKHVAIGIEPREGVRLPRRVEVAAIRHPDLARCGVAGGENNLVDGKPL